MNIVLLKSKTDRVNITSQQNAIIKYAKSNGLSLDATEIEGTSNTLSLEDRKELKGFLRSLNYDDSVLIYDLWTFSDDVGELNKIFECLLKRSITIHVCAQGIFIDEKTPSLDTLALLARFREKQMTKHKNIAQGRPKGRMSKSKFDSYRKEVVDYLSEGKSVSEIARILSVSRTSLKDYINSRGLKELVVAKKTLLDSNEQKRQPRKIISEDKECSLIQPENTHKEIDHVNM